MQEINQTPSTNSLIDQAKARLRLQQEISFILPAKNFFPLIKTHSEEIFTYLECHPKEISQYTNILHDTLEQISSNLGRSFLHFQCQNISENVKDFILNKSDVFIDVSGEKSKDFRLMEDENSWDRYNSLKTDMHRKCVTQLILPMAQFPIAMNQKSLPLIVQYFKTLYFIDDFLSSTKLLSLCRQLLLALQTYFSTFTTHLNQPSIVKIIQFFSKILRVAKDDTSPSLRQRVHFLNFSYGITLLKQPSLTQKIMGVTKINTGCHQAAYSRSQAINENTLVKWLCKQDIFSLLFQHNFEVPIIKMAEDIMRLLIMKEKITPQQYKLFYSLIDKASPQMRKIMFKMIEAWRMDQSQKEIILDLLAQPHPSEFYNEDLFYYIDTLSRYLHKANHLDRLMLIMQDIVRKQYNYMKTYYDKKKMTECYTYILGFHFKDKRSQEKIDVYLETVENYLTNPIQIQFVLMKAIMESTNLRLDRHEADELSTQIVDKKMFVQRVLVIFTSVDIKEYKDGLVDYVNGLLKQYNFCRDTKGIAKETVIAALEVPEIFQQLVGNINYSKCQSLLKEMTDILQVKEYSFQCIKQIFQRLNIAKMIGAKKELTDKIAYYVTNSDPTSFIGINIIKYIVYNTKYKRIRQSAAQLIAFIYTNWSEQFKAFGQVLLKQFLQQFVQLAFQYYKMYKQQPTNPQAILKIYGVLQMSEQLLLATQYHGVGRLKAHNSLVPTSTTKLKVYNNVTHGDDVLTTFQKNIPSNHTLYEVIVDVAKQFKIDPHDIGLEFQHNQPIKHNGLTLEELQLNKQQLNAYRLPQSRAMRAVMIANDELSDAAKAVFTEIFHKFAVNGRMGRKEASNYIYGITQLQCPLSDYRLIELFQEYDTNRDDELVLQDFLRFYKDKLMNPYKCDAVEKNIEIMRFRKDLKQYDQPTKQLNEELLCRYHLCGKQFFYEMLFIFTQNSDPHIRSTAQRLLVRLPTYAKIIGSFNKNKITFENKNSFQSQYILTAIQAMLATKNFQLIKQFISLQNHLIIFHQLHSLSQQYEENKKCIVLCLHILRSLLQYPNLKQSISTSRQAESMQNELHELPMVLPPTTLFSEMVKMTIHTGDLAMLQPALALQLTQESLPIEWNQGMESAVYNQDRDIRLLTCNFLYYWQVKTHFQTNIFQLYIRQYNNKEWFDLLTEIVQVNTKIPLYSILELKIADLHNRKEELDGIRFDTTINGNLNLIKQILKKITIGQQLINSLNTLSTNIISNENRKLLYEIRRILNPDLLAEYLLGMGQQELIKETDLRSHYVGIYNLGCICYMNSILQQFFMIQSFRNAILAAPTPQLAPTLYQDKSFVDDFLYQLQDMYAHLSCSQKKYYHPKLFCLTVKDAHNKPINTAIQEDAHEFLNTAFDKLQKHLKHTTQDRRVHPELADIFGGTTVAQIICLNCKNKIEKEEQFYHLSLQLQSAKQLNQCFRKFTQMEEIQGYTCEMCKVKAQKITKQTFLKKVPKILIINLMRITYDKASFIRIKVHSQLIFPTQLLLNDFVHNDEEQKLKYNLKGVVIHSGTVEGGHYFSLIREGMRWYKFDDQTVSAFDLNDLAKVAFGGEVQTSNWAQHTSSTNAYILFYEQSEEQEQCTPSPTTAFHTAVQQENIQLYKQVQLCQPSYFQAVIALKDTPHGFALHLQAINILQVYYQVDKPLITTINDNILQMLNDQTNRSTLVQSLIKYPHRYIEGICMHKESSIQKLNQSIVNKAIGEEGIDNGASFVKECMGYFEESKLKHFVYKSYYFFQFWRELCQKDNWNRYLVDAGLFGVLLDVLYGSAKSKTKPDVQMTQGIPIRFIISSLMNIKLLNIKPNTSLLEQNKAFSERQISILKDIKFYKKIISNRYDSQFIGQFLCLAAANNWTLSKKIGQMLLKGINNKEEIDCKPPIFRLIKAFILIEDGHCYQRMQWMLGIPQLVCIGRKIFGLQTNHESNSYEYKSGLSFEGDCYQPILNSVFNKRKYFNAYTAHGIKVILQLTVQCPRVLHYILDCPAPYYSAKTYFDWVDTYIVRLRNEEHYGLEGDRVTYANNLQILLKEYRVKEQEAGLDLPINKYIVGKNYSVSQVGFHVQSAYSVRMERNHTYVLPNLPKKDYNQSLPVEIFSINAQNHPIQKYFLKGKEGLVDYLDIKCQPTALILQFKAIAPYKVTFNGSKFKHSIYFAKEFGIVIIPYEDKPMFELVKSVEIKIEEEEGFQIENACANQEQVKITQWNEYAPIMDDQIICSNCTSINSLDKVNCDVCELPLLN